MTALTNTSCRPWQTDKPHRLILFVQHGAPYFPLNTCHLSQQSAPYLILPDQCLHIFTQGSVLIAKSTCTQTCKPWMPTVRWTQADASSPHANKRCASASAVLHMLRSRSQSVCVRSADRHTVAAHLVWSNVQHLPLHQHSRPAQSAAPTMLSLQLPQSCECIRQLLMQCSRLCLSLMYPRLGVTQAPFSCSKHPGRGVQMHVSEAASHMPLKHYTLHLAAT